MTAPVKPVDAWAVVGPDGAIRTMVRFFHLFGISWFRFEMGPPFVAFAEHPVRSLSKRAMRKFISGGYRCVRVTVAVKEGE